MRTERQHLDQTLADRPNEWTEVDSFVLGSYRQMWIPGAFGDRPDIKGVQRYRVIREGWVEEGADGRPERRILEAKVMDDAQEE